MITAKLNINKTEISLIGSKEDVLYVLRHTLSEPNNNYEIKTKPSGPKYDNQNDYTLFSEHIFKGKKSSLYTKEQMISMYEYLQGQGNYTIKQFEITRGGKKDPQQYTVCLVFDEDRQRYIFYNPKTEDKYCGSFTVIAVLDYYKLEAPGFSLLHTIANKLMTKMNIVDNLTKVLSPELFPIYNEANQTQIKKS